MKRDIIITTTNSIEGADIEKYIDLISTNVVLGTNFFSDFGASLTDLFGGYSENYQGKLEKIYKIGLGKLQSKAINLGANAVIGVKTDFDEISGKGKSMFMLSVVGTCVKIKHKKVEEKSIDNSNELIPSNLLQQEVTKRLIIKDINNDLLPTQDEWGHLINYPIKEISKKLLDKYLKLSAYDSNTLSESRSLLLTNFPIYLLSLDKSPAEEIVYEKIIKDNNNLVTSLICKSDLFSANEIIKLINKGLIHSAVKCLQANKNYYSLRDLNLMKNIITLFENIDNLGKIEVVKSVIGKEKEKYICPNGHKNDSSVEYCLEFKCDLNIKELTEKEVEKIEEFKIRYESLCSFFGSK